MTTARLTLLKVRFSIYCCIYALHSAYLQLVVKLSCKKIIYVAKNQKQFE